ncbi:MAG: hypothetical protein JRG72_10575 [Deltaproteobacteria bacterium]|nr:hypothetical protein [Deltaproteobacteria bacterium]
MKNIDQTFRIKIKRLLVEKGETITSMARKIDRPFGSVVSNVYGYRTNQGIKEAIANFLGHPVEDIFDFNGNGHKN